MSPGDVLELLLPDAAPGLADLARRVATFARLLAADARPGDAGRVQVDLERARAELERESAGPLRAALGELLRLHLDAALGVESFLCSGAEAAPSGRAWSVLEEQREDLPWLPEVPAPGETAAEVAARLIAGAERLGLDPVEVQLARARLARASAGPERGAAAFRALLESGSQGPGAARLRRGALAGAAACLLDLGAVREAAALLDPEPARRVDPRLRRLHGWCRLLLGDVAGAREALARASPWSGPPPAPLARLREELPAWLPLLAGRAARARGGADAAWRPGRAQLGAVLLAVFRLEADGSARALHLDVAPGLRERLEAWLAGRAWACGDASELEHRLVAQARAVVAHHDGAAPLRGALAEATALAVALEPALDATGEVCGWVRVECEHHLLPSRERLARLAEAWRARLERGGAAPPPAMAPRPGAAAPTAAVFAELVRALGMKTQQRHWWGFAVHAGRAELVAEGGATLAAGQSGGARAVARALLSGGAIAFEEPAPQLALAAASGSGLVLPLRCRGVLCGLLAVESARRRDLRPELAARWSAQAGDHGLRLRVAQVSGWHRERHGAALHFGLDAPAGRRLVQQVLVAGRARGEVVLCGGPGSGRRALARWLHFESERHEAPLWMRACADHGASTADRIQAWLERARGGTLVLTGLERAPGSLQQELLALLAAAEEGGAALGARIVLTCGSRPRALAAAGALAGELAARLERLVLQVPPLRERREELPELARLFAARFAAEQGLEPPRLEDPALAVIWRQPWEGNLRELGNALFRLVLEAPGREPQPQEVEAVLALGGSPPLRRLPSRHPPAELVRAALRSTRTQRGSLNKTRAALYLGWDPDTLVARMRDLGIPDGPQACDAAPLPPPAGDEAEPAEAEK